MSNEFELTKKEINSIADLALETGVSTECVEHFEIIEATGAICGCLNYNGHEGGKAIYVGTKPCRVWINTSSNGRITTRALLNIGNGTRIAVASNQGISCY